MEGVDYEQVGSPDREKRVWTIPASRLEDRYLAAKRRDSEAGPIL
jgi:hypothetical protein